jgi:hypothetical protein
MKKYLFILIALIVFPTISFASSFPEFPMAFWGTATLNGQSLPSGTSIKTYCDNNLVGEVTILENGIYGYVESTKIKLLAGDCNGDILFKYLLSDTANSLTGVNEIKYIDGFQSGVTVNKNLDFITVQSCNITNGIGSQTWTEAGWGSCTLVSCNSGYSSNGNTCAVKSSGGGGGGGGGNTPAIITTTGKKGDANGDSKVDKYDFSLMMANWGKTGTNTSDFNNDGKVDKYDFALLMSNWGL